MRIIIFSSIAVLFSLMAMGQSLEGSYIGKISTEFDSTVVLFRFKNQNGKMKGFLDLPEKSIKDIPLDKVWILNDSIFADARNSMGWPTDAPLTFKGKVLGGNHTINGVWAGSLSVKLEKTDYVFSLKTNPHAVLDGYKVVKLIESTPIKDQHITGACWSFATTSFIETEAIRLGKRPVVLSPMFFVSPTYIEKAERYIRKNGVSFFSEGDLTFSVLKAYKKYGAIPESVYSGKINASEVHDHSAMNTALLDKVKYYAKSARGNMSPIKYKKVVDSILSATMGEVPASFDFKGKHFTPKSFAEERIGINPDDYVEITSFSHHPFYSKFVLEIEANWDNNEYLNLPLADFASVVDHAILNNYSVAWDGDTYEDFKDGFAAFDNYRVITQEVRQEAFDNRTTEDVHNMHIIGIVENEMGSRFYVVKNSSDGKNCGGYMYMSREYLLLKTISVLVNKNALSQDLKKRLKKGNL